MSIQSLSGKVSIFSMSVMTLAFVLPFYKKAVPAAILLVVLSRLIEQFYAPEHFSRPLITARRLLPALGAWYLLHVLGMIWSVNVQFGLTDLEYKLSLLVFPLLFYPSAHRDSRLWVKSGMLFIAGYLCFMLFSLSSGLAMYLEDADSSGFFYSGLSQWFHPSYQAMYGAWALLLLSVFMQKKLVWWHWLLYGAVLLYIDLLSSKSGMLSAALVILISSIHFLRSGAPRLRVLAFFLVMSVVLAGGAAVFPKTSQRIQHAVEAVEGTDTRQRESTNLRKTIWKVAAEEFIRHPFGVGTGDVKDHLVQRYEESGAQHAFDKRANPHNQYLQTAVALGWPGLLLLLLCLVYPLILFIRYDRWVEAGFFALTGFNLLFESMLEVQSGVVFFAFWYVMVLNDVGKPE